MKHKKSEKGQAIILIVLAMVGLIGMTGLTVDGGMAFTDRRHAQNAADSAAFAAALAHTRSQNITTAAKSITTTNGYNDDKTNNTVTITSDPSLPIGACPPLSTPNLDITVTIVSNVKTAFAPIVGVDQITNTVSATSRACGTYVAPIFGGNAIVGLNTNMNNSGNTPCGIDFSAAASANVIVGGGLFSNGCAYSGGNTDVTVSDKCVSGVGTVYGEFADINTANGCSGAASPFNDEYLASIMPDNPCDGTAGDVGKPQSDGVAITGGYQFNDGVYCITNFNAFDNKKVVLNYATLYVTKQNFDVSFQANDDAQGFSGYPTKSGDFSSYFMVVEPPTTKCTKYTQNNTQTLTFRGSSNASVYGTILAPGACIDLRGNTSSTINGQIIGYTVSTSGSSTLNVNYVADQNRRDSVDPTIQLIK